MSVNFGRSKTFLTYGNKKMEGLSWKHCIIIIIIMCQGQVRKTHGTQCTNINGMRAHAQKQLLKSVVPSGLYLYFPVATSLLKSTTLTIC